MEPPRFSVTIIVNYNNDHTNIVILTTINIMTTIMNIKSIPEPPRLSVQL